MVNKCHETIRRTLSRVGRLSYNTLNKSINKIYSYLLLPFINVFCFFSINVNGFKQITRHLTI
jgi:hypothetical protein